MIWSQLSDPLVTVLDAESFKHSAALGSRRRRQASKRYRSEIACNRVVNGARPRASDANHDGSGTGKRGVIPLHEIR